ncbi:MAG: M3 family oligoendopeptidase, partial [Anaerolineae bacterium]|nr:M3 family oligoendopeptidase [Anaerolineae bacterium]
MSFSKMPAAVEAVSNWTWEQYAPFVDEMLEANLTQENLADWLGQWTQLSYLIGDTYTTLQVAMTVNTADEETEKKLNAFLSNIMEKAMAVDNQLKEKFLKSGLTAPEGFEVALKIM